MDERCRSSEALIGGRASTPTDLRACTPVPRVDGWIYKIPAGSSGARPQDDLGHHPRRGKRGPKRRSAPSTTPVARNLLHRRNFRGDSALIPMLKLPSTARRSSPAGPTSSRPRAAPASRCRTTAIIPPLDRGPVPALHGGHRETPRPPSRATGRRGRHVVEPRPTGCGNAEVDHGFPPDQPSLDCPVSPAAVLAAIYYMKHGLYDPRMTDEKVHSPAVPLGRTSSSTPSGASSARAACALDEITGTGELASSSAATTRRSGSFRQGARQQVLGNVWTSVRRRRLTDLISSSRCACVPRDRQVGVPGCARGCNIEVHVNRRAAPREGAGRPLKPRFNADVNQW